MEGYTWNENGWTCIQEADAGKHILEVNCLCEKGMVVKVIIRHNDGEESVAKVTKNGANVLPISYKEFQSLFEKKEISLR